MGHYRVTQQQVIQLIREAQGKLRQAFAEADGAITHTQKRKQWLIKLRGLVAAVQEIADHIEELEREEHPSQSTNGEEDGRRDFLPFDVGIRTSRRKTG